MNTKVLLCIGALTFCIGTYAEETKIDTRANSDSSSGAYSEGSYLNWEDRSTNIVEHNPGPPIPGGLVHPLSIFTDQGRSVNGAAGSFYAGVKDFCQSKIVFAKVDEKRYGSVKEELDSVKIKFHRGAEYSTLRPYEEYEEISLKSVQPLLVSNLIPGRDYACLGLLVAYTEDNEKTAEDITHMDLEEMIVPFLKRNIRGYSHVLLVTNNAGIVSEREISSHARGFSLTPQASGNPLGAFLGLPINFSGSKSFGGMYERPGFIAMVLTEITPWREEAVPFKMEEPARKNETQGGLPNDGRKAAAAGYAR